MRVWKKLLSGAAVSVSALALAAVVGTVGADASVIPGNRISVDYGTQKMTVNTLGSGDTEVFVTFPTVKTDKSGVKTVTEPKDNAWDSYDAPSGTDTVDIDLSKLNPTNDSYVMIKGNKNQDAAIIHFAPSVKGAKLTYDPINETVSFADSKKNEITGKTWEYRSAYGTWAKYEESKKLNGYAQQGVTVYFREQAAATSGLESTPDGTGIKNNAKTDPVTYDVYEASNFAGAESKVKITKLANGPSVKVDYAAHTFTIPMGAEYRFNATDSLTTTAWTAVTGEGKKANPVALSLQTAGVLEARVAAVTEGKVKAASKYTRVVFDAVKEVNVTPNDDVEQAVIETGALTFVFDTAYDKQGLAKKLMAVGAANAATFELVACNEETDVTEIAAKLADKTDTSVVSLGTVKPGKTVNLTAAKANGKYIYVRIAADAKQKVWSTGYKKVGQVTFPVQPGATSTENPDELG